ncbi:hypothetical protein AB1Y20_022510 [Prymnesium parvum]|uniref:Mechanosensitive ion channel MscS domain-containing protein n=1 Tax=Prymnesium parvum TaxID=97485 RepID=A0AB34JJS4_PRYPA
MEGEPDAPWKGMTRTAGDTATSERAEAEPDEASGLPTDSVRAESVHPESVHGGGGSVRGESTVAGSRRSTRAGIPDDIGLDFEKSTRAGGEGRMDENKFAEALQVAHDLKALTSTTDEKNNKVTNPVEAFLLGDLDGDDSMSSRSSSYDAANHETAAPTDGDNLAAPPVVKSPSFVPLSIELPSCTEFSLHAIYKEACRILVLVPVYIWLSSRQTELEAETDEYFLVYVWPLCAWLAARVIATFVKLMVTKGGTFVPWQLSLLWDSAHGCPITSVFFTIIIMLTPHVIDVPTWHAMQDLEHFWPVMVWFVISGATYGLVIYMGKLYVGILMARHYGQRATAADGAQRLLRKIATAAQRNHRLLKYGSRTDHPSPIPESNNAKSHSPKPAAGQAGGLQFLIGNLGSTLDFGGDTTHSLDQARRRARKLFEQLMQIPEIVDEHEQTLNGEFDKARLLAWLQQTTGKRGLHDKERAASLFGSSQIIDRETFITGVERCYKEQRLLHASVTSFDAINAHLVRALVFLWGCISLFFFLVVIGVPFNELIIPSVSLVISVVLLAGRAPADFISGALYVLLTRPFDIGDRITISDPGKPPILYSIIVKNIELNRTYFLTSNGELLHIENHILRSMSMVNLTRSGPFTLMFQIQVPHVTPTAKITELVDGIKQYVAEKSTDWSHVDLLFSKSDFATGHLVLDIWATSTHPAHEVTLVYSARSSFFLFIHTYMQAANIEYVRPTMGVRLTSAPYGIESPPFAGMRMASSHPGTPGPVGPSGPSGPVGPSGPMGPAAW